MALGPSGFWRESFLSSPGSGPGPAPIATTGSRDKPQVIDKERFAAGVVLIRCRLILLKIHRYHNSVSVTVIHAPRIVMLLFQYYQTDKVSVRMFTSPSGYRLHLTWWKKVHSQAKGPIAAVWVSRSNANSCFNEARILYIYIFHFQPSISCCP